MTDLELLSDLSAPEHLDYLDQSAGALRARLATMTSADNES